MNDRQKVDVLLTDGRTVPIVKAVETRVGVRFVDTIGRVFRPDQVVAFGEPRPA
ncbi:MAG: hypothetical protein J2P16_00130 [Mycobacterium sp.]|nr:hypothetical protein [Mycobacterium sp.]